MSDMMMASGGGGMFNPPTIRNAQKAIIEIAAGTRVTIEKDAAQALATSVAIGNLRAVRRDAAEAAAEDPAGAALYDELSRVLQHGAKMRLLRMGL